MIIAFDTDELYEIEHKMIKDFAPIEERANTSAYIAGINDTISEIIRYAEEKEAEQKKERNKKENV